jgi:hypothetical protein
MGSIEECANQRAATLTAVNPPRMAAHNSFQDLSAVLTAVMGEPPNGRWAAARMVSEAFFTWH